MTAAISTDFTLYIIYACAYKKVNYGNTVVGYMVLRMMKRVFMEEKLYLFAFYCWAVGLLVLALGA